MVADDALMLLLLITLLLLVMLLMLWMLLLMGMLLMKQLLEAKDVTFDRCSPCHENHVMKTIKS